MFCVAVQPQVARVPVRIIVVETQEKAEHILGELKAGADFATVAKAESADPTAADGGSLGTVTPDGLRTELRSAMLGLDPGQFSGIVRIPSGLRDPRNR
jgi:parvulin-like peptidyl-prolyl isomerase